MREIIKTCDNCQAQTVYIGYEPCHSCNRGREGMDNEIMKDNWIASDLYKAEQEAARLRAIIEGFPCYRLQIYGQECQGSPHGLCPSCKAK
jgi:hypothetical protein